MLWRGDECSSSGDQARSIAANIANAVWRRAGLVEITRLGQRTNRRLARPLSMKRVRYSIYAVERGGKFLKNDFRSFTRDPLAAIHFADYSRTAERAAKMGGKVVRITIEHPGVYRDIGDLINTRVLSANPALALQHRELLEPV